MKIKTLVLFLAILMVAGYDRDRIIADDHGDDCIDIDGNVYKTVRIGDQLWMAENLKVTHYRNGEAIPNVTDDKQWAGLTTGAWCVYNNDASNRGRAKPTHLNTL